MFGFHLECSERFCLELVAWDIFVALHSIKNGGKGAEQYKNRAPQK